MKCTIPIRVLLRLDLFSTPKIGSSTSDFGDLCQISIVLNLGVTGAPTLRGHRNS